VSALFAAWVMYGVTKRVPTCFNGRLSVPLRAVESNVGLVKLHW